MTPASFPEVTHNELGKPKDWKNEDCYSVPARIGVERLPSGALIETVTTFWVPSLKELDQLNEGGGVYLKCCGGMPPVTLTVDKPF